MIFDGKRSGLIDRAGTDRRADSLWLRVSGSGAVRQPDGGPKRRVSAARATENSDQQMQEMVLARLAEVGLPESIIWKKPAELSGGMRKRVGLARALALSPELMLYDEPTTGLDPIMSDVINELILRTRSQHPVTSVVVTHDMRTAQKVADRVMMLYPLSRLRERRAANHLRRNAGLLDKRVDPRVTQFVHGEAGERLMEMRKMADLRPRHVTDEGTCGELEQTPSGLETGVIWMNESSNSAWASWCCPR